MEYWGDVAGLSRGSSHEHTVQVFIGSSRHTANTLTTLLRIYNPDWYGSQSNDALQTILQRHGQSSCRTGSTYDTQSCCLGI